MKLTKIGYAGTEDPAICQSICLGVGGCEVFQVASGK